MKLNIIDYRNEYLDTKLAKENINNPISGLLLSTQQDLPQSTRAAVEPGSAGNWSL